MDTRHCRFSLVALLLAGLLFFACSRQAGTGILRIGLAEGPRTLNVWLASDANSSKVLSLIYQPLYLYDPDTLDMVPWLADGMPVYDASSRSYTVKLKNARWSDGTPFTSADVAFTGRLILTFKIPRFMSSWRFIEHIATPDAHSVIFYLKHPMAAFMTSTLFTPIVQQKQWAPIARRAEKMQRPLTSLLDQRIDYPVGTGPFTLVQWRQGAFLHLKKNPYFFGSGTTINGHRLGPFVNDLIYSIFGTSDVAVLALEKGSIDMFWWPLQPGYMEDLSRRKDIRIFVNPKSALYFIGFNLRHPPFDDITLRRAAAYLIDKRFIVQRILQGQGTEMFSVIPAANRFWHCKDLPRYGDGMSRKQRIITAYRLLSKAGYTWAVPPVDAAGRIRKGEGIRLPDGKPMARFTILTPPADYDPDRATTGLMIQEWLRALGMPAYARPEAFSALLEQVKVNHHFDAFILGYGHLRLDPDYVRNLFYSANAKRRGWNMSGYKNAAFDAAADLSIREMDPAKRRALVMKMQELIARDLPYIPLYKPSVVEAVRTDRFVGWVPMVEGIGNIWSLCEVRPVNPNGA
jgi:peptide/nickel transport system substrate-binding protein